ncbi:MAG: hypothetical protein ACFFDW_12990 [Candidatus Thorarchaeota archaeon]
MNNSNKLDVVEIPVNSNKKTNNNKKSTENEIKKLISTPEFIDFIHSIEDSISDGMTFNELLSSQEILHKAIEILKKHK